MLRKPRLGLRVHFSIPKSLELLSLGPGDLSGAIQIKEDGDYLVEGYITVAFQMPGFRAAAVAHNSTDGTHQSVRGFTLITASGTTSNSVRNPISCMMTRMHCWG